MPAAIIIINGSYTIVAIIVSLSFKQNTNYLNN